MIGHSKDRKTRWHWRHDRGVGAAAVAALTLGAVVARAQAPESVAPGPARAADATRTPTQSSPATSDVILPPRLLTTELVPYPASGRGRAAVVLELVVETDGSVGQVRVVSGPEPFAGAALEAAREWRFAPATVNGVSRAARVEITTEFEETPEREPTAPDVAETRPAGPTPEARAVGDVPAEGSPTSESDTIEVEVHGEQRAVGKTTLTKLEIRDLPGAMGDPFRAVEAMPGVTPVASGLPFFFIRGAPPGNQGYYFDGVRVPLAGCSRAPGWRRTFPRA